MSLIALTLSASFRFQNSVEKVKKDIEDDIIRRKRKLKGERGKPGMLLWKRNGSKFCPLKVILTNCDSRASAQTALNAEAER